MTLNKHFREFIKLLDAHGVEYLVVGGYAVGFHGFPRYTGDIDIFVSISAANATRILDVFREFGFGGLGLTEKDFMEEETIVEIGREPVKIQIPTGIDGVTFERCHKNRVTAQIDGLAIPFISLADLMANKAATQRAKDKIDLDELRRLQGEGSS
jgi:predicted nucleotidyltransferase